MIGKWPLLKIQDFADVVGGGTPSSKISEYWGEDIPWVTPADLSKHNFRFISKGSRSLSLLGLEKSSAKLHPKGTILMSSRAPIGYLAIASNDLCTNQGFQSLRCNSSIVNESFVYYQLKNNIDKIKSVASGSTFPEVSSKKVKGLCLPIPNLSTQKKIASILSAYDDLIENNLKRIKLLEEKAQLTYEEWFVRMKYPGHENDVVDSETGLPKGWTKYMLSEAANFLNGYAFKPKDLVEKGYPVIKIKEMKNGVVSDTPRNSGDLINEKYLVNKGDILFSWSATLEVIIWKEETGLLNQHLFKVTPKEPFKRSYVYLACKNALKQFELLTTGATMKHIKRKELDFVTANFPGARLMSSFEKEVEPLLEAMVRLKESIGQLNMAKDVLLPRLMSGMIDIDEIKYNYPKEILE